MKIFTSLLNWNHSLPTPTRWESLNLSELLVWKLGILFFWCRSLMSIKTDFESPVVWFVFVSIIICILPSECLTINDWQQPEWVEFNWFYYSQAGAGTISCVRFVMVGRDESHSLTKTFRIIICIKGHHFIQETSDIINNKLENHLATQFSNSLGVVNFKSGCGLGSSLNPGFTNIRNLDDTLTLK